MRILIVEDNQSFAEILEHKLSQLGETALISTESEFFERFSEIEREPPDVAILDVMMRWDYPRRDPRPVPPDARNIYDAGIRCARRLQASAATKNVPIIMYTVFTPEQTDAAKLPNVHFVTKGAEDRLVAVIREVTKHQ